MKSSEFDVLSRDIGWRTLPGLQITPREWIRTPGDLYGDVLSHDFSILNHVTKTQTLSVD